jgi:hypothetical protein
MDESIQELHCRRLNILRCGEALPSALWIGSSENGGLTGISTYIWCRITRHHELRPKRKDLRHIPGVVVVLVAANNQDLLAHVP